MNRERLARLGWSRAILLQAAHPLVAAGIADHSAFQSGARAASRRLRATIQAMRAITCGDDASRAAAIAHIRQAHRRVHGALGAPVGAYPAGTRYSADDPALVLWAHAAKVESTVIVYERFVGVLSPEARDAYCDEAAATAIALGAAAEQVPRTWSALARYLEAEYASGRIAVSADARAIADALLFPPWLAVPPPVAWMNRLVTIGLLPDALRQQYRYGWNARRARQLDRLCRALGGLRRGVPAVVAWWPDARRRN